MAAARRAGREVVHEGDDGDAGAAQLPIAREDRRVTELVLDDDVRARQRARQRTEVRRDGARARRPRQRHDVDGVSAGAQPLDEQAIVEESARDAVEVTEEHEGDAHGPRRQGNESV